MEILSVYAISRVIYSVGYNVAVVTGQVKTVAILSSFQSVAFLATIYPAFLWSGAEGVAYAKLVTGFLGVAVFYVIISKKQQLPLRWIIDFLWRPATATLVMVVALLWVESSLPDVPIIRLLTMIPLGAIVYSVLVFGLWFSCGRQNGDGFHLSLPDR